MAEDPKDHAPSVSDAEGAPAQAQSDEPKIPALIDLFDEPRANPARWLKTARSGPFRPPGDEELAVLTERITKDRRQLDRLLAVLRRLTPRQTSDSAASATLALAGKVLAHRVPQFSEPPRESASDIAHDAVSQLRDGPGTPRERQSWIEVALRTLVLRGDAELSALPILVRAAHRTKTRPAGSQRKKKRATPATDANEEATLLWRLLGKPQVVAGMVAMGLVYQQRLYQREDAIGHLEARLASAQARLEQLEQDLATEVTRRTESDAEVARLKEEIRQRQVASDSRQTRGMHELETLKGRMRGLLKGDLAMWLETARDAATASPPRIAVVTERLERALERAEKEAQWLASSDSI